MVNERANNAWQQSKARLAILSTAGMLQAMSLAWPLNGAYQGEALGWLQCMSFFVLAFSVDRSPSAKQAFIQTWLFSFAWLGASIWWLFISMHRYGGLPAPIAGIAVAFMAAGLALIYGSVAAIYTLVCQTIQNVFVKALVFASAWTLAEIVRGTLWTGFPWGAVGYAHVDGLLRDWAPWVGVYGLCAMTAFIAMTLAAKRQGDLGLTQIFQFGALAFVLIFPHTHFNRYNQMGEAAQLSGQPLRVTLLQGNISQDLKFGEGVNLALRDYDDALRASQSDLTVTPETAIPLVQQQLPAGYWQDLEKHFSKGSKAALVGVPLAKRSELGQLQYSNSAIALMPQATPSSTASYQYDKHHLVPFGEFVPPLFQWFVRMMNIPLGDFIRGDLAQPSWVFKGERIAPNICYEDLFGEELARSFADPDNAPTLMVNLSNIAWFGDTVAIDQHLNISRMRALELGRPMLRATNTGATAIIDAQGQVTHRLPSAVQGVLTAEVYGVHGPVTPYARWVSAWGLWPLAGLAVLTLLVAAAISHAARHGQRRFGP